MKTLKLIQTFLLNYLVLGSPIYIPAVKRKPSELFNSFTIPFNHDGG